jgi:signal transduction histidine kinase/DNA-directed RNA polymerase subunit N (RpoN/RPB10)
MKLHKQEENEVLQAYDTWLASYLNGDIKTYDSYLDVDYRFIGSTDNEEFLNKKDTTNFLKATADQLAGKAEVRNSIKTVEKLDGLVFITDLFDAYFLNGTEWAYYGRFRFTSALRKNKEGWRFVYQHFSTPDVKAQEGETLGTEQITKENQELRDAIKRRTVELEHKNRELEIEASLERVRARSLAMQSSDELLAASDTMFAELEKLSINALRIGICTINGKTGGAEIWSRSENIKSKERKILGVVPKGTHPVFDNMVKAWKEKQSFFTSTRKGKQVEVYYKKLAPHLSYPLPDSFNREESITAFFFPEGSLNVVSLLPLMKSECDVMLRFSKVFGQIYRRFLDLQKAETQAREAEIELALERVRARTMAMQKSDELKEVVKVIFDQMAHLKINADHAGILVDYKPKKDFHFWVADNQDIPARITVPYLDSVWDRQFTEAKKKGKDFFTTQLDFEQKNSFYKKLLPHIDDLPKQAWDFYLKCPGLSGSTVVQKEIGLYIENFSGIPFSDEENSILMRFGKVFQQTYTRFLDLQKAEVQAREAEIELALERVRARTMAMQYSDDLAETAALLFKQIADLGIETWTSGFNIWEKNDTSFIGYNPTPSGGITAPYRIPSTEDPFFKKIHKAKKNSEDFLVFEAVGKSLAETYRYMQKLPIVKDVLQGIKDSGTALPKSQINHCALFSHGFLLFITMEPVPDAHDIFKRFAKVFDQTYTRFLDLQKAEAQAREAQIETALERVRSRSMAMQKSDELFDVGAVLYRELSQLGIENLTTGYVLFDETARIGYSHGVNPSDGSIRHIAIGMPHDETPVMKSIVKSWKKREPLLIIELNEEETIKHQTFIAERSTNFPLTAQKLIAISPKRLKIHTLNFKQGYLLIVGGTLLTKEQQAMAVRFAKVFEQVYTRFQDLQKAEAQTREAQINLAVERVRAKALAMHRSEEIMEVVAKLKDEVMDLNIPDVVATTIFLQEGKDQVRMWDLSTIEKLDEGYQVPLDITFTLKENDPHLYVKRVWENTENFFVEIQDEKGFSRIIAWLREYGKNQVADEVEAYLESSQIKRLYHAAKKLNNGKLVIDLLDPPSPEIETILTKMGAAFDLAYKRFEDLQNAEAQAREGQIELGLERVRARTMAMQHSDELGETSKLLDEQVRALGIKTWGCAFNIYEANESTEWFSSEAGVFPAYKVPRENIFQRYYEAGKKGESLYIATYEGAACVAHYDYLCTIPVAGDALKKIKESGGKFPSRQIDHVAYFKYGYLLFITLEPVPEAHTIFKRFATVFEQTYTRFLDLKKAEAQTREAQIETALERVRSRTMAMHKSAELAEVAGLLFKQVNEMGINIWTAGFNVWSEDNNQYTDYITSPQGGFIEPYLIDTKQNAVLKEISDARKSGVEFFEQFVEGEELKKMYLALTKFGDEEQLKIMLKDGLQLSHQYNHFVYGAKVSLMFISYEAVPEAHDIFKRFGKVFEQTYTRFLDLQKAEAQAREAQIEAALERVRSRSMAMHRSEELSDVIAIVSEQLQQLKVRFDHVSFAINSEDEDYHFWTALYGKPRPYELKVPYLDNPIANRAIEVRAKGLNFFQDTLTPEENREWLEHAFKYNSADYLTAEEKEYVMSRGFSRSFVIMPNIILNVGNYASKPYSDEDNEIIKRFAAVFEQSYTRFLDLQKAEAQAREALIETGLERVRAQTMAMNKSEDLQQAVAAIFKELDKLDLKTLRCGIGIIDGQNRTVNVWTTTASDEGEDISFSGNESMDVHPLLQGAFAGWEKQEDFYYELKGEDLIAYYKTMGGENYKLPVAASGANVSATDHHHYYCTFFPAGGLYFFSEFPFTPELVRIIRRFANAFSLTYKRFEDLKLSEEQAHKAKIEVALERVRARALAMQQPEELVEVAEVLRYEMGLLGVEELETCSIYINDMETKKTECWYALKDIRSKKKKLVSDHFPLDLKDTWVGREMKKFYTTTKKQVSIVMKGEARKEWIRFCEDKSVPFRGYYGDVIPDRTYHLYKFTHGAIGAAAAGDISSESWDLLKRAASVFSLAYSRFQDLTKARTDLQKLKTEKQRAEDALSVLKATQTQLIQSEKMASLGELTAGIAHEIQNPLNFVNNFSEVSNELVDEMNEELDKGDIEEAKAISVDIKQNLEKINHHGKRADAIVKGMLQHSRRSSGQKEPTDINALADEYLRLAYHGLRAKDKSFNATMNTDFDPLIGNVNVVPQDIGRVILNLITNAFYAVNERSSFAKASADGYEPTVWVSTKKDKNQIMISVRDNGNGIPEKVKDKIFQPFFTTKPTGQGTGLGLSLSYDIVKAHGGELRVETKEGEGCTFNLVLSIEA